jgi:hypothetical protein
VEKLEEYNQLVKISITACIHDKSGGLYPSQSGWVGGSWGCYSINEIDIECRFLRENMQLE